MAQVKLLTYLMTIMYSFNLQFISWVYQKLRIRDEQFLTLIYVENVGLVG